MSGFGGVWNREGSPVGREIPERIAEALRYRAWDGLETCAEGELSVVHARFWTTPEDEGEIQPRTSASGRFRIVADARLDNRSELLRDLRPHLSAGEPTDADVIVAAFELWGERCLDRLVGDFAFAVWAADRRELFLARDPCGVRQLFYSARPDAFCFGTTVGAVLAGLPQLPALNGRVIEEMLRDYFRLCVTQTAYQGVLRVPPGYCLRVTRDQLESTLYSTLVWPEADRPASHDEWVEEFRRRLDEAIRCRLRSGTPVASMGGGGVDSSAIACIVHELLGGGRPPSEARLYGTIFPGAAGADETEHFEAVRSHCHRLSARTIPGEAAMAVPEFGTDHGFPLDEPDLYLLRGLLLARLRAIPADGCRVALSGEGANQALGHAVYSTPAVLHGVGWRNLIAEAPHFRARSTGWWDFAYHACLEPVLPEGWVERARRWRRGETEWPGWVKRQDWPTVSDEVDSEYSRPKGLHVSAHVALQRIRRGYEVRRFAMLDVTAAYAGLEIRLPFYDRRVVELLLASPKELRSWRGEDRIMLRRVMNGRMPERIRTRTDKAHLSNVVARMIHGGARDRLNELSSGLLAAQLGFIDGDEFRAAVERCWKGETRNIARLGRTWCLESWLRSLDGPIRVE